MTQWEDVAVPKGAYIGWGTKPGQQVTGRVMNYEVEGALDFNDKPCPLLELELINDATSTNKDGEVNEYSAGEFVVITAGQVSLKRALRKADPAAGDLVAIEMTGTVKTAKGTVKEFEVKIARGAGGSTSAKSAPTDPAPAGMTQAEWDALPDTTKAALRGMNK